jgi:hypothetical protein
VKGDPYGEENAKQTDAADLGPRHDRADEIVRDDESRGHDDASFGRHYAPDAETDWPQNGRQEEERP